MKLFRLLRRESETPVRRLLGVVIISGLCSILILMVLNAGVTNAIKETHSFIPLLKFLIITAIYFVSQRYVMVEAMREMEKILHRIRVRIVDKIRKCDLEPLEVVGRSEIYTSLSRETQSISQGSGMLVVGLQSGVLLLFAVVYLLSLSPMAFAAFIAVCIVAAAIHKSRHARLSRDMGRALQRENKLLEILSHVLDGFAEVKMNPRRSDDLFKHLSRASESASTLRINAHTQIAELFIVGQTIFYVMLAAMVFVVPRLSQTYNDIVVQATTAVLFLTGPISTLISSVPSLASTDAGIERLEALEAQLDDAIRGNEGPPDAQIAPFDDIRFEGTVFRFHHTKSERPFTLGPIDVAFKQGETVFIVGGNGSGKSTFLRLLTSLYYPDRGSIQVNGEPVEDGNVQAYRNLFSVIFADFHLFDQLYGLGDTEEERVTALLEEMELAHKISYHDGAFSTLDLSTGQKKRLAYIVSLLEDRPIYVFDEWAAGQDPEFREKFYRQLLPDLKRRGKTIIAVTHDDHYWDCAERVLKMADGRFVAS